MEHLPLVTVVLPVRNEAGFIARSLSAVCAQDYPFERMEVIVADGLSDDGTRQIAASFAARDGRLQVLDNPGKIVPTGMNLALRKARGQIIIRVDGHCEIAPDYVSKCVAHLLKNEIDGVGGPIETVGQTYCAQVIASAMSAKFGVGGSAFRTVKDREMLTDTLAFPAYTRAAVEKTGFFDEELVRNQDDEYNYRLSERGGRLLLAPDIKSRYYSRSTIGSLWRQYFQYGYWKVRVAQKHPGQMRARQFAPPLFVAAIGLAFCTALFSVTGRIILGGLVLLYLLSNLGASLLIALREKNWRVLALLPVCFATLHFAYGLGCWMGVAKFRRRWRDRTTTLGGDYARLELSTKSQL